MRAKTFAKYASKLPDTERLGALNPARVAALFAVHQAELDVLHHVLAACSEKASTGYPAQVSCMNKNCPFDGSKYEYEQLEGGKGFVVTVASAKVGDIDFPEIKFQYVDAE